MVDIGREWTEILLVRHDLAGQRHAEHGAAVKGAGKGDNAGTAGMGAGDLHCVLDRLGAGRHQHGAVFGSGWRHRVQPLGELQITFVGRDMEAGMGEVLGLFGDGAHDGRVAVAGIVDRDAGGEVDITFAIDVPELGIQGLPGKDAPGAHATRDGGFLARLQIC